MQLLNQVLMHVYLEIGSSSSSSWLLQGPTNVVIIQSWFKKLTTIDQGRNGVRFELATIQHLQLPRS